ncbi:MAG: hypothetical protein D6731_03875 [Planctomycetota bacterium]|nr:MAG: hypothetical protein D6731_03875 [Planctomycetota bacterium]
MSVRCAEVRDLIHPFLDGELEVDRNVEVLKHFELCGPCRERVAAERLLRERVSAAASEPAPDGLCRRLVAAAAARAEREVGRGEGASRSGLRRAFALAAAFLLAAGLGLLGALDPFCWRGCTTMEAVQNTYVASAGRAPEPLAADEAALVSAPRCRGLRCLGRSWVEIPGVAARPVLSYRCEKTGKTIKFFRVPEGHLHATMLREYRDGRRYVRMRMPGGASLVLWTDRRGVSCAVAPPEEGLDPEALLVMATALRDAET